MHYDPQGFGLACNILVDTEVFKPLMDVEHKLALNHLSKILQTNADITEPTFKHSAALSKNERVLERPEILSDVTGQAQVTPPIPQYERRALQLAKSS